MIIALCGKPSSGKSTFFKAATLADVEIAPYPFTTIEKNEAVAYVKTKCIEKDFDIKCNPKHGYCIDHCRFIPIKLIDVAGLVPGASEGKGRGNAFLDDLSNADVLIHIVDVSGNTNEKGEVTKDYDPVNDIKWLEDELDKWFLGVIKKGWEKFVRSLKAQKIEIGKAISSQLSGLKVDEEMVKEVLKELELGEVENWKDEELEKLSNSLRKKSKPMIIACNKIDVDSKGNFDRLKKEFKDYLIIACSSESELALKEASKKELIDYVPGSKKFKIKGDLNEGQEKGLDFIKNVLEKYGSSGVQDVLDKSVFEFLKFIVVYPVENSKLEDKNGNKLPDAFLMKKGSTALDLAFKIHSDIGSSFIKGINMKDKKVVGKEYVLKNNDVIEIVSGK